MPGVSYSFANRDGSFLSELGTQPVRYVAPLTGATITMNGNHNFMYVDPAGTIATLTIKLPPSPTPGMTIDIGFSQIVTTLTINDSAGSAVTGAATAAAVGVNQIYRWIPDTNKWVKWK
jgi:hypothetical protein